MLAYFREDRIPILSKIVWVPDHPWQSRNSVPPDISLQSWLSRNRRVSNMRESQEIWFFCTNCMLMMFGRTEFRFCQKCEFPIIPDRVGTLFPRIFRYRVDWVGTGEYLIRWVVRKFDFIAQPACWWCSGGQNSDSVKNSVSSRSSLTESELCPPGYFVTELIE